MISSPTASDAVTLDQDVAHGEIGNIGIHRDDGAALEQRALDMGHDCAPANGFQLADVRQASLEPRLGSRRLLIKIGLSQIIFAKSHESTCRRVSRE